MKTRLLIIILALVLLLPSCAVAERTQTSYAMGSLVSQTVYSIHDENTTAAIAEVIQAITELEARISYREPTSDIYRLNNDREAQIDPKTEELLYLSYLMSLNTEGAYDITVLPAVLAWGFEGDTPHLPDQTALAQALASVDYTNVERQDDKIILHNGATIDLSASGKGAACDVAYEIYQHAGVSGAVISVGGSIAVYGTKNGEDFTIGVRDPFDPNGLIGTLSLTNCFVSTSGSYEKYFDDNGERYHHILDPRTGYPAKSGLVAVTVVHSNGAVSDMLATACMVLGLEAGQLLLEKYGANAVFVQDNGKITVTSGLKSRWAASS